MRLPEYFPTILAIASTGISALFSSTNSLVSAAVINGPIRDKLTMNYGIGAMGPFNQPNATIGRAWTLMSRNLDGGGICGETYMGSQGNVINYSNLIIPENEKDSPWPPFHVQKGFKPEESVISFFFGFCITQGQGGKGLGVKPVPLYNVAMSATCRPSLRSSARCSCWIRSSPTGWAISGSRRRIRSRRLAAEEYDRHCEGRQVDALQRPAERCRSRPSFKDDDGDSRSGRRPDAFNFVVVGGQTNPYHQLANISYRVSVSIDKWL